MAIMEGTNPNYNWDNHEIPVQKWLIAYHDGKYWKTITLPGEKDMDISAVEKVIKELNKKSAVVYSRIKQGVVEPSERHKFIKGGFFCL